MNEMTPEACRDHRGVVNDEEQYSHLADPSPASSGLAGGRQRGEPRGVFGPISRKSERTCVLAPCVSG